MDYTHTQFQVQPGLAMPAALINAFKVLINIVGKSNTLGPDNVNIIYNPKLSEEAGWIHHSPTICDIVLNKFALDKLIVECATDNNEYSISALGIGLSVWFMTMAHELDHANAYRTMPYNEYVEYVMHGDGERAARRAQDDTPYKFFKKYTFDVNDDVKEFIVKDSMDILAARYNDVYQIQKKQLDDGVIIEYKDSKIMTIRQFIKWSSAGHSEDWEVGIDVDDVLTPSVDFERMFGKIDFNSVSKNEIPARPVVNEVPDPPASIVVPPPPKTFIVVNENQQLEDLSIPPRNAQPAPVYQEPTVNDYTDALTNDSAPGLPDFVLSDFEPDFGGVIDPGYVPPGEPVVPHAPAIQVPAAPAAQVAPVNYVPPTQNAYAAPSVGTGGIMVTPQQQDMSYLNLMVKISQHIFDKCGWLGNGSFDNTQVNAVLEPIGLTEREQEFVVSMDAIASDGRFYTDIPVSNCIQGRRWGSLPGYTLTLKMNGGNHKINIIVQNPTKLAAKPQTLKDSDSQLIWLALLSVGMIDQNGTVVNPTLGQNIYDALPEDYKRASDQIMARVQAAIPTGVIQQALFTGIIFTNYFWTSLDARKGNKVLWVIDKGEMAPHSMNVYLTKVKNGNTLALNKNRNK